MLRGIILPPSGKTKALIGWSLLALSIIAIFIGIVSKEPVLYSKALLDVFIPINAGKVFLSDFRLHIDYISPFGWIYFFINSISIYLIDSFNFFGNYANIHKFSGAIFSIYLLLLFLFARKISKQSPSIWFLAFCIAFANSPSLYSVGELSDLFYWYAPYNRYLWSMFFIMSYVCFDIFHSDRKLSIKQTILIALFFSTCNYVNLHYKLNYFIGSLGLSAAIFLCMQKSQRYRYALYSIVFLLIVSSITWLSGYSYAGYISNLIAAASGRHFRIMNLTVFMGGGIFLVLNLFLHKEIGKKKLSINKITYFTLYTLSILVCCLGEGNPQNQQYFMLTFLFWLLYLQHNTKIRAYNRSLFSVLLLLPFIFISLKDASSLLASSLGGKFPGRPNSISLDTSSSKFEVSTFQNQNTIINLQDLFFDMHAQYNDQTNFFLSTANNPLITFTDVDLLNSWNDGIQILKKLNLTASDCVETTSTVNPFPALHNCSFPKPAYHWKHIGVTVNSSKLDSLNKSYSNSDIVLVAQVINGDAKSKMNSAFYEYNKTHSYPFKIISITDYWIAFANEKFLKKPQNKNTHF